MLKYIIAYVSAAAIFFAADMLWLAGIAKRFYRNQLGDLMLDDIRIGIAAAFYATYIVGIVIFAIKPALASGNTLHSLWLGCLFGFFCYATYDFTNLATLKNWPVKIVMVDILWGTMITGATAYCSTLLTQKFFLQ